MTATRALQPHQKPDEQKDPAAFYSFKPWAKDICGWRKTEEEWRKTLMDSPSMDGEMLELLNFLFLDSWAHLSCLL